jgi:hypothetical protein
MGAVLPRSPPEHAAPVRPQTEEPNGGYHGTQILVTPVRIGVQVLPGGLRSPGWAVLLPFQET